MKGRLNRWVELALVARVAVRGQSSPKAAAAVAETCSYLPTAGECEWPATYNALKSLVHAWGASIDDAVREQLALAVTATLNAIDQFPAEHLAELVRLQQKSAEARRTRHKPEGGTPQWWQRY